MYKQKGENDAYPMFLQGIWCRGWKVPEWLSNNAKVTFIDGEGNTSIEINDTGNGGYEIKDVTGVNALVSAKGRDSIICYGLDNRIMSLTRKQFELLYIEA